jgi:predicted amidophosphoribosyltransferase
MPVCKNCKKKYEEGSSGYCAACLAAAQSDLLGRWDDLGAADDRQIKADHRS